MSFFKKLTESIPFSGMSENAIITIVILLIVGFSVYIYLQYKKSIKLKEMDKRGVKREVFVNVSDNSSLAKSKVGKVKSKENAKVTVKVSKGSRIENSEVGKIED